MANAHDTWNDLSAASEEDIRPHIYRVDWQWKSLLAERSEQGSTGGLFSLICFALERCNYSESRWDTHIPRCKARFLSTKARLGDGEVWYATMPTKAQFSGIIQFDERRPRKWCLHRSWRYTWKPDIYVLACRVREISLITLFNKR